ncbi:MAG: hypothetical protein NVS4B9_27640 [Ktedonobacteraceae bacterium]
MHQRGALQLVASRTFSTKIEVSLRKRFESGEYDTITSPAELCNIFTIQMYEISKDRYLRISYHSEAQTLREDVNLYNDPEWKEAYRQEATRRNFGFNKVERLTGNIGYLDLRDFDATDIAGDTAMHAMNFLAHTNALIIDLRQNGGGEAYMVHLISSYLFDPEPVHLNDFYLQANQSMQQFWTLPYVPGKRYGNNKPVYVLTGPKTFSAAEEFAYNLKSLKRATIVGETTSGGANPTDLYQINPYVDVHIPMGRAVNPITGTNWEGTGVTPDIQVSQETALQVAHVEAVKNVLESLAASSTETENYEALVKEARALINGILSPDEEKEV